jgi:hypothetical protein
MNEKNKLELFEIVSKAVIEQGQESIARKIQACNAGNLDGYIVTNENLHLFRQYRNQVSNNSYALIYDAIKWATDYLYLPKGDEVELSIQRTSIALDDNYSNLTPY